MKRSLSTALAVAAVLILTATVLSVLLAPPNQDPLAGKVQVLPNGQVRISGGVSSDLWRLLQQRMNPPTNYTYYAPIVSAYPTLAWKGAVKDIQRGQPAPDGYGAVQSFGKAVLAFWERYFTPMPDIGGLVRGFFGLFTIDAAAACGSGGGSCFRITSGNNWDAANSWSASSGGGSCGAACVPAATDTATFDGATPAGTVTMDVDVTVAGLTMGRDILSLGHHSFTVNGNMTLSGGAIDETGNHIDSDTVTGNVNISSASSYIAFGQDNWTIGGSWTNASTSASWSPGTAGTVTFDSTSDQTMTFAGSNIAVAEFSTVGFRSTSLGTVTFTMQTRGIHWSALLHIHNQNMVGTTVLTTSGLPLTGGDLHMADDARKGTLLASTSTVSITNWDNTASAANIITVTSGAWTVSGNYSGANSNTTFNWGTGSVAFTGAGKTITDAELGAGFYDASVSGTYTLLTAITATHTLDTSGAGTLTTAGFAVSGGAAVTLTGTGGIVGSTSAFTIGAVAMGAGTTFSLTSGSVSASGGATVSGAFVFGSSTATFLWAQIAATGYFNMGSASITVTGSTSSGPCGALPYTWCNQTTDTADWSPGTSTVTVGGTVNLAFGTANYVKFDHALPVASLPEFHTLALNATNLAAAGSRAAYPLLSTPGDVLVLQNLSVQGIGPGSVYFDVGAAADGSSFVINGNVTGGNYGQIVIEDNVTVYGNWDQGTTQNAGSGLWGQFSTVTFAGVAQNLFCPNSGMHASMNSIVVSLGDVVTVNGNTCSADGTVTVNGTMQSVAPLQRFILGSATLGGTATPLVLGAGGDVSGVGMIEYLACNNPAPKVVLVTATTYWYLDMVACTGYTIKLAGDVATRSDVGHCSVDSYCSALFSGYTVLDTPDFYTQDHSMNVAGIFWVGDLNIGGTAHFGNSTVTAGALDAISGTIYLENATLNLSIPIGDSAHVCDGTLGGGQPIQALTTEYNGTIHGGTSTVNAAGYCVRLNTAVGGPQSILAENMAVSAKHVIVADATDFIDLGASTWTISGVINSVSTSASWNSGTSTVIFTSATGGTFTPNALLPVTEFHNLTFKTSAGTAQTFTLSAVLAIDGVLTVDGANTTFNPAGNAVTERGMSLTNSGTLQSNAAVTITTYGNWNGAGGLFARSGVDTEVFAADGTISTGGGSFSYFYNMTVNIGVTTTALNGFTIGNIFTVNGTYLGGSPNDPQLQTVLYCASSSNPCLVLGGSGDLTQSGYMVYSFINGGDQYVTATTYQHLAIEGISTTVAHLLGDVSTPSCGVYNECAIILTVSSGGGSTFEVHSDNHAITAGGTFWIGDGGTQGATFYAGSSVISAFGIAPNGEGIAHWQSATIDAHPSSIYDPIAYYSVDTAATYLENATLNVHGQLRLWAGSTTFFDAGSGAVNVLVDAGSATAMGFPGDVKIVSAGDYIDFGSSSWTIYGVAGSVWQNLSTSASWDAGTSAVTFASAFGTSLTLGDATNYIGAVEFHDVVFDPNAAASPTFTIGGNPLTASGVLSVRDSTAGGTTTLTDAVNNLGISIGGMAVGLRGALTLGSGAVSDSGNWDSGAGTVTHGTSTVTLSGSGSTIKVNGDTWGDGTETFYSLTFDTGSSYTIVIGPGGGGPFVERFLTVKGEVIAPSVTTSWGVHVTVATPVVLVAGYDLRRSGEFVYSGTCALSAWNVTGGTYNLLNVFPAGSVSVCGADQVTLAGDIVVFSNDLTNFNEGEFILAPHEPSSYFDFFQNGFDVTANGAIFFGDTGNRGVHYHTGTGMLTANDGMSTFASTTVLDFDSATVIAYPITVYNPIAFYPTAGRVNGDTANITIHGSLRVWGVATAIYGGSATWNVLADVVSTHMTADEPGMVHLVYADDFINFGSSSWTMQGAWYNVSTDNADWSAGTGTVTFDYIGTAGFRFGAFAVPEFHNVTFDSSSPTPIAVLFDPTSSELRADGSLTVSDASSVTALVMTGHTLTFKSLTVSAGGEIADGSAVVSGISISANAGTVLLDAWVDFSVGATARIEWHFDPSAAGTTVTIVVGSMAPGQSYALSRDGAQVAVSAATGLGVLTYAVVGGWSAHEMVIGGAPKEGGSPSPPSTAPSGFAFSCGQGFIDWLNPIYTGGDAIIVTFTDDSVQGRSATQYLWNFGDGSPGETTTVGTVTHSFRTGLVYSVEVQVTYSTNAISSYSFSVDARGAYCSLQAFARTAIVPLYAIGIASALASAAALLAQRKRKGKGRLFKALLALSVISFLVPLAVYLYAYFAGVPIG